MTDTLNFEKSAEWFMSQSKLWSKRGDDYKSLLYARRAYESGSLRGKIRMAKALYESGNFHRAYDVYARLYLTEAHTEEVCVGITKCLKGMANNRSMAQFIQDAAQEGTLVTGAMAALSGNTNKAVAEIMREYPDEYDNKDFAKLAYLYFSEYLPESEVLFREIDFTDDVMTGGLEAVMTMAGIPTLDKFTDELAVKTLKTCDEMLEDEETYNVYEALTLRIVCLVKLGRTDEAYDAADELIGLPFPEDNFRLLKCANALMILEDSDGAIDYLEELLLETYNEILLLFTAIANMNEGRYERAKELFSNVLLVNPDNLIAKHWMDRLCKAKRRSKSLAAKFKYQLPRKEEVMVRSSIDKIYDEAEVVGYVEETEEMRQRLKYELESANFDFSSFVGHRAAVHDIFSDVCEWYLCNPRGALSVKRDILLESLSHDYKRTLPVFIYGLREQRVKIDLGNCGDNLRRAYAGALATVWIFVPDDCDKLNELFTDIYPLIKNVDLPKEIEISSLSAALLYIGNFSHIDTEKMATDLFVNAKPSLVHEYCKMISGAYPKYERSKKKSR